MASHLAVQHGGFTNPFRSLYRYLTRKNRRGMKKSTTNNRKSRSRRSRSTRKLLRSNERSRIYSEEETKENSPIDFTSKSLSHKGFPGKLPPKPALPAPPSFEGTQGFAKFGKTKKTKSRSKTKSKTKSISPIKRQSNIKKKNGIIKGVREFTRKIFTDADDIDFAVDDVRYDRDGFMFMRAPCRNGHALYNVIDHMKVTSIPVKAKAQNRTSLVHDLEIKDAKLIKDVNHALEKYHKRKIEEKGMALTREEYMEKCYPDADLA